MRIAINAWFLNQPGAGSGQYLHGLLRALPPALQDTARHHQILLVAPRDRFEPPVPGLEAEYWPLRSSLWRGNLGKLLFEQIAFPWICRRWRAGVAHVPYWGSPLWPTVPTVVTIHDLIPMILPAYRGNGLVRAYTRLVAASARRAALVLTDSLSSRRDIEQHLRLRPGQVRSVYLGTPGQFRPEPDPADASIRRSYGLPDGSSPDRPSRYVLYLAGHDLRKNVAALVEAFATVAAADSDVALVIGGKIPDRPDPLFFDPRPLISALELEADVRIIGWVDEVHKPALYRGAACAVFVSHYEGFGLPVLEALACGTPLVASNTSSLPELLGDAGFAVDPDDVQALAGSILSCLVDETLAADLRHRGPRQAGQFTWAKAAQETVSAYLEAAALGGR